MKINKKECQAYSADFITAIQRRTDGYLFSNFLMLEDLSKYNLLDIRLCFPKSSEGCNQDMDFQI